ncbi:MAG: membrane protein insertase YidC, partial [Campylobacterota bacterium]
MLEKFTPNQRLLVAVALSFLFFIGYTTVFPPETPNSEQNTTEKPVVRAAEAQNPVTTTATEANASSAVPVSMTTTDTLTTVSAKEFTLKIDTLGRISSVVLSNAKHNGKDGKLAELVSASGAKPLYVRFADEALNDAASKTPYTASVNSMTLGENGKSTVVLTQALPGVTLTKTLTFYSDGHYDAKIALSNEKRYFVYLGQHPQIIEQIMTVVGSMVYSGDSLTTIFEDGDVEGRSIFSDVHLASSFDQYYASIMYGFDKSTQVTVERDASNNPVTY